MSTQLNFGRDVQGFNAFAPEFGTNKWSATIVADADASITVPANYPNWIAVFSFQPGTNVWVANNTTATVPVGSTFDTTSSELNPSARWVHAGDVLSFITDNVSADVGVSLYVKQ